MYIISVDGINWNGLPSQIDDLRITRNGFGSCLENGNDEAASTLDVLDAIRVKVDTISMYVLMRNYKDRE